MAKSLTVQDFFRMFPDDNACLNHLFRVRFGREYACPKCGVLGRWTKLAKIPAFSCICGHHVHPMAGSFFQDSRTPLQKWFYAIYLFTTTRHGVAAKELQRQLSVTYKTAWRMAREIRKHMGKIDGDRPLTGEVECDETYVGGKQKGAGGGLKIQGTRAIVFGMLQRDGDVITKVVEDTKLKTLYPIIAANVERGSTLNTDEARHYMSVQHLGYTHKKVNHKQGEYVNGSAHTNSLENLWSQLKRSIRGTHIHVSKKYLALYLAEFEFRFNLRNQPHLMFDRLLARF